MLRLLSSLAGMEADSKPTDSDTPSSQSSVKLEADSVRCSTVVTDEEDDDVSSLVSGCHANAT